MAKSDQAQIIAIMRLKVKQGKKKEQAQTEAIAQVRKPIKTNGRVK